MVNPNHDFFEHADPAPAPTQSPHDFFEHATDAIAAPKAPQASGWESAGRGAAQGATFGLGDEIQGAVQASLPMPGDPSSWSQRYDKETAAARADNERARAANPATYHASEFVSGLPAAIATGGAGSAAGRVAAAGAYGGVSGFGHGEGTAGSLVGAGLGAATGAGGQAVIGEALAPWLAGKLYSRARDLTLERSGLTRRLVRSIERSDGNDGLDSAKDEIYRVLQDRAGARNPLDWLKTNQAQRSDRALQEAKDGIGGFMSQADDAVRASGGTPQALTPEEVIGAAVGQYGGAKSAGAKTGWGTNTAAEAENLLQEIDKGTLDFAGAHKASIQAREGLYPASGALPPTVKNQLRQFIQETQEAARERAIGVTPQDAKISPDTFRQHVGDYKGLIRLEDMTRQQGAHDSVQGLWSWLNEHGAALGAGGVGAAVGHVAEHPMAAAGMAAAGLGKVLYSSPVANRAASAIAGSPVTAGMGRQAFAGIQQAIGQPAAAAAFTAGQRPHPEDGYTPPSPLREGP